MKTVTTREYDADGHLIREVTVTEDERPIPPLKLPGVGVYPSARCTCGAWLGVLPPPPCPVHGGASYTKITCSSSTEFQPH